MLYSAGPNLNEEYSAFRAVAAAEYCGPRRSDALA